jgi:hypothetical protein
MRLDVQHYRSLFAVTASSIYMSHAAVAPISPRVGGAMASLKEGLR